jgi:predicted amidohydrolase YtcJ
MKYFPALLSVACSLAAQPAATLVLNHARVWTGNTAQPAAQGVASLGSRIVAVGSDAEVSNWIGPGTVVVDLKGRRLVPGFNDAHVHFADGGEDLASVDLRSAKSEAEFTARITAFAAKALPGAWIRGGNWDHENWTPARLPTHELVDGATGDHPLWISRLDGHMGLANALALKLAKVTRETRTRPAG